MKRFFALALMLTTPATANESIPDQYPDSLLYSAPVEVIPHVWAAIGQTAAPNYENAGHNNNLGFIVTGEGVVVVNAGGSALIAEALHDEIKKVTDEPVKLVINVNGLGNTMLGNSYWAELDVPITSHDDAAVAFQKRGYPTGRRFSCLQIRLLKRKLSRWDASRSVRAILAQRIHRAGLRFGSRNSGSFSPGRLPRTSAFRAFMKASIQRIGSKHGTRRLNSSDPSTSFPAMATRRTWRRCGGIPSITCCTCAKRSSRSSKTMVDWPSPITSINRLMRSWICLRNCQRKTRAACMKRWNGSSLSRRASILKRRAPSPRTRDTAG